MLLLPAVELYCPLNKRNTAAGRSNMSPVHRLVERRNLQSSCRKDGMKDGMKVFMEKSNLPSFIMHSITDLCRQLDVFGRLEGRRYVIHSICSSHSDGWPHKYRFPELVLLVRIGDDIAKGIHFWLSTTLNWIVSEGRAFQKCELQINIDFNAVMSYNSTTIVCRQLAPGIICGEGLIAYLKNRKG